MEEEELTKRRRLSAEGFALRTSAHCGISRHIRALVKRGIDVNSQDEDGKTALICAIRNGHEEAATALIDCGADVNISDENGNTALRVAVDNNHSELIRKLIDGGATVNAQHENGETTLMTAARSSRYEALCQRECL